MMNCKIGPDYSDTRCKVTWLAFTADHHHIKLCGWNYMREYSHVATCFTCSNLLPQLHLFHLLRLLPLPHLFHLLHLFHLFHRLHLLHLPHLLQRTLTHQRMGNSPLLHLLLFLLSTGVQVKAYTVLGKGRHFTELEDERLIGQFLLAFAEHSSLRGLLVGALLKTNQNS